MHTAAGVTAERFVTRGAGDGGGAKQQHILTAYQYRHGHGTVVRRFPQQTNVGSALHSQPDDACARAYGNALHRSDDDCIH